MKFRINSGRYESPSPASGRRVGMRVIQISKMVDFSRLFSLYETTIFLSTKTFLNRHAGLDLISANLNVKNLFCPRKARKTRKKSRSKNRNLLFRVFLLCSCIFVPFVDNVFDLVRR